MRTRSSFRLLLFASLFLPLVLLFQNCSGGGAFDFLRSSSSEKKTAISADGGNGEPYGGKPTVYQSYMEGFYCTSTDGQKIPSPYSVVEKIGDTLTLVNEACESKNQILSPVSFLENTANNTAAYDFRRFYKDQDFINDVIVPKFNFEESFCSETIESRILRAYGTINITPDQMKTAKADYVEIKMSSMFYGQRTGDIRIVKNLPLIITSPDPNLTIENIHIAVPTANIQTDLVSYGSQTSTEVLDMQIGRSPNAPVNLKINYEGTLNYKNTTVDLSNIRLSCPIYPHF